MQPCAGSPVLCLSPRGALVPPPRELAPGLPCLLLLSQCNINRVIVIHTPALELES